jgi:CubicO group peptidase (beta-lactamase class C family)
MPGLRRVQVTFAERLRELFVEKSRQELFSGAVLISQNGKSLFEQAYGYANRSWRVENRVDTRFRIGSISKMFTAVAVLQLVDNGKISLDTSVVECLGLRDGRIPKEATVYHMLTMISGIADWFDESGDWEQNWAALCRKHPIYLFRRNHDYLPLFVNEDPIAPVGERHQCNGAGYILLGLVIEKVSGCSYFDWVSQQVFAPAQMMDSGFLPLDGVYEQVAEGYMPITDSEEEEKVIGWKRNIYSITPEAAADGGATSTVHDLERFSQALRGGRLLSARMTQAMLTHQVLADEERFRGYIWKYGYANMFILDEAGRTVRWGHTGEEDGVSCRLYYYPEHDLDVIFLANQSWCAGSLAWEVHDLILQVKPAVKVRGDDDLASPA